MRARTSQQPGGDGRTARSGPSRSRMRETGDVLGSCGIGWQDRPQAVAEIGYWVRSDDRRRGVATRAVRARGALGVRRVRRPAAPASRRRAQRRLAACSRAGGLPPAKACSARSATATGSERRVDFVIYSLLPGEAVRDCSRGWRPNRRDLLLYLVAAVVYVAIGALRHELPALVARRGRLPPRCGAGSCRRRSGACDELCARAMSWAAHDLEPYAIQKHLGPQGRLRAAADRLVRPRTSARSGSSTGSRSSAIELEGRQPGAVPPRLAGRRLHALAPLRDRRRARALEARATRSGRSAS